MFALPLAPPSHNFFLSLHSNHAHGHEPSLPDHSLNHGDNLDHGPPRRNPDGALSSRGNLSAFALLKADEDLHRRRKENIARFGATWIRPPGISKTLQAEQEERAEREEQEALARREQMMLDMQARQEEEELRGRMAAEGQGEGDTEMEERDLDDEVPDADEDEDEDLGMSRDLSAEEDDGEITTVGEVTFNDGSLIEGSMLDIATRTQDAEENEEPSELLAEQERYARLEEAELTGVAQDEYDLGMQGDLDDSVPEAGSYEHTDSELEDDEDDLDNTTEEDPASFISSHAPQQPPRADSVPTRPGGLFESTRSRLGHGGSRTSGGSTASRNSLSRDASSLLDSSFVTSSPVMSRLRTNNHQPRRNDRNL